jgi:hypothetical protein
MSETCVCAEKAEIATLKKELKDAQDNLTTAYFVGLEDGKERINLSQDGVDRVLLLMARRMVELEANQVEGGHVCPYSSKEMRDKQVADVIKKYVVAANSTEKL